MEAVPQKNRGNNVELQFVDITQTLTMAKNDENPIEAQNRRRETDTVSALFVKSDYKGDVKLGDNALKYYQGWQIVSYTGKDGKKSEDDNPATLNALLAEQAVEMQMIPSPLGYDYK